LTSIKMKRIWDVHQKRVLMSEDGVMHHKWAVVDHLREVLREDPAFFRELKAMMIEAENGEVF